MKEKEIAVYTCIAGSYEALIESEFVSDRCGYCIPYDIPWRIRKSNPQVSDFVLGE